jgi:hypothetical protein
MPTDADSDADGGDDETPDQPEHPEQADEADRPADPFADEDADYGIAPDEAGEDQHTALPPKVEGWRRRSATGAVLTGFALGLQSVFEPKRDEPSIVLETSGDPPQDLPVEADMEYRRPRQTVVNIRPWLLDQERSDKAGPEEGPGAPEDTD